jgi:hypothetical protein
MPGCTRLAEWTCPPLPHGICHCTRTSKRTQHRRRRRPRQLVPVLLPPCDPPLPLMLSRPLRPLDRPGRQHGPACGDDALMIRRGECRSHPRTPRRGMGPWRQRRRRPVLYVPGQCLKVRHGIWPGAYSSSSSSDASLGDIVCCGGGGGIGGGGRRGGEGGSCVMWLVEQLLLFGPPRLHLKLKLSTLEYLVANH